MVIESRFIGFREFDSHYETGDEADVFRIANPLTKEVVKQVEMETELTEREQLVYDMICEKQKINVDDIAAKLDVIRRTVLRDVKR